MIVASNASPLIHLARIGQLDLLSKLFGTVRVPEAVWHEIVVGGAGLPGAVEVEGATWITSVAVLNRDLVRALEQELDAGESEAIALAIQVRADLLLMDERLGREIAEHFGQTCLGLIGVSLMAKQRGFVSAVKPILDALRLTANFWISDALYTRVLEAEGEGQ